MLVAFQALGSAVYQVWTHIWLSILGNVSTVLFSLPLFALITIAANVSGQIAIIPLGAIVLVGVLPNPAAAGLQYTQLTLSDGDTVYPSDVWHGLRTYALPALPIWLISALVSGILAGNMYFYTHYAFPLGGLLTFVALYFSTVWLAMHLFVYPLILRQDQISPLITYRNAFILLISRPLVAMIVTFVWFLLLASLSLSGISTVLGLAVGAAIQNQITRRLMPMFTRAQETE